MEISLVFQEHPNDDVWEEYAFGRLSGDELDAADEHLLLCEHCQGILAYADEYRRFMKYATARFPEAHAASRWQKVLPFVTGARAGRLVSAGTVAAACVAALVWLAPQGSQWMSTPKAVAVPVELQSLRAGSAAAMSHAPAGHPLDLSISAGDVPPSDRYRVEVVTSWGEPVWSGMVDVDGGGLEAHIGKRLTKGTYWVRLYTPSSELLAEYGLRAE